MIKVSHFVKFSEALSTTLIDRFALYLLDKLFFLLHNLINSGISILVKCKRTRDKESGTIRLEMYRVISCKSFTYLPLFLRINYYTEFHSTEEFQRYKNKKKKPTIFPSDYSLNQKFLSAENWGKPDSVQWRPPEIARAQTNNTFLIPLSTLSPVDVPACPRKPVRQKQRARSTGRRRFTCSRVRGVSITPPRRHNRPTPRAPPQR